MVSGESAQITPNEDARLAPNNRSIEVADRQLADNFTGATTDYSVANNSRNVNEDVKYKLNPEHEAQVRAYNEHITRLRQREEYLRGQGMSENAPAMINLRKAQEQAIYARDHIGEVDENGLKYKLSPEQEAFFKDSKVRDEDGNLMKMYHGSPNGNITEFRPGTYFTKDKKYANGYQNPEASYISLSSFKEVNDPKTYEVYINSKNPFTLNDSTARDIYLNEYVKGGNSLYLDPYSDHTDTIKSMREIDWMEGEGFREWLQENHPEYDSLYLDEGGDGGYGEKTIDKGISLVMTKPEQIKYTDNLNPTDSPDMRYKRQAEAKIQEVQQSKELLARHLQLTGDENLVFNEWQNEMQKRALGYYDPKTDQINLNKLTEDTLNHELGHKLLTRVENKQDLLNSIRESYGDDYLINKYGSQYGNDLNLLAEEQLADGFSDYYNGRLKGEDKVRLGARLGIPQKVLAIYDRITEAIMGLVGKQDAIKQFYAQMETGKFRTKQQVPGGDGRVRTMSIEAAHDGRNIVVVNNNILKGVPSKQIVPTIRKYLNENFKGNDYPLNFGNDGTGTINRNTIRKYVDPHQTFEDILIKGKMAGELPDILKVSKKYAEAPDMKAHSFAKDGFEYRTSRIEIDGQQFDVTINVGLNSKGKLVYAFNNIKRIPANRSSRRFSSGDSNVTIPNNPQDVNTDNRYQHPLQETINEMEANPKPRMTRELREAIDEFIYENIDQNLFLEHSTGIHGNEGGRSN